MIAKKNGGLVFLRETMSIVQKAEKQNFLTFYAISGVFIWLKTGSLPFEILILSMFIRLHTLFLNEMGKLGKLED